MVARDKKALNAVVDPILMSDKSEVTTKHSRTAFVGVLFHSVIREKVPDAGNPLSRLKAHIRREDDAKIPKSAKAKMRMIPLRMAVEAFRDPVASWNTTKIGNGAARTLAESVMQYKIVTMYTNPAIPLIKTAPI